MHVTASIWKTRVLARILHVTLLADLMISYIASTDLKMRTQCTQYNRDTAVHGRRT
jgi:hypothetical protein